MAKVFSYHNNAKDKGHWFPTDGYGEKEIEAITDPEGGEGENMPTAVPSPFARMDLVLTAFTNINKTTELVATSKNSEVIASREDEKLVSDTLDLIELLFNIDNLKERPKIIVWDKAKELRYLSDSEKIEHRRLGDALSLYLQQDKETYNFDSLKKLYIIEYQHQIIGATSPVTLFFPSANDLTFAKLKLSTDDVLFDENYTPLYKREREFQLYLHLLFRKNTLLTEKLWAFADYLEANLKILSKTNPKLQKEIKEATLEDFDTLFDSLNVGVEGNNIEVLGCYLGKRKKVSKEQLANNSDFIIQATKPVEIPPLVLRANFNQPFRYVNSPWKDTINVPNIDAEPLNKRWLPDTNIQYPYLTVSDFLEPYIIQLLYPINSEKFFNGNFENTVDDSIKEFVLPLKQAYFNYFTTDDLFKPLPDGKKKIEIIRLVNDAVKVVLRVPIAKQREYITYERIYYPGTEHEIGTPNEIDNKGVIIENQFSTTIFPFIKTKIESITPYYRVQLIDRDVIGLHSAAQYDIQFYTDTASSPITVKAKKERSKKQAGKADSVTTQYYQLEHEFDYMQVSVGALASGIVIPRWPVFSEGNEQFTFAVDFGTTNTHIEYKMGGNAPKAFDISSNDMQLASLFKNTDDALKDVRAESADDIYKLVEYEMLPEIIGKEAEFSFPQRTVLSHSKSLDIENNPITLADFNIPFVYEKYHINDEVILNLKWAKKEAGNTKRVRAFFEKLIMLMSNKVLLNNGKLAATKLIWFYPSSMTKARKADLTVIWEELFTQYFNPENPSISISESLAPFYYYKYSGLKGGSYSPVVSIDIGGGTTDVIVFKANQPLLLTSFKFAGNSIFGDGFSQFGAAKKGLVNKYYPYFANLLNSNNLYDLSKVLSTIKGKEKAEDINAFFFSLEKNKKIAGNKDYAYNYLLTNDDDLKIIFLYFYTAIIYHIANFMKLEKISLPKNVVFSGTGSKIITIVSPDTSILSKYTQLIFEKVYEEEIGRDGFTVEFEKEFTKEITCKGGLQSNAEELQMDVKEIKQIYHHGINTIATENLGYKDLNDDIKSEIVAGVEQFNTFFKQLHKTQNFTNYFNVSSESYSIFVEEANRHLRDYLEDGIELNKRLDEALSDDDVLEETLFFYPILGTIHSLLDSLSELSPIQK